MQVANKPTQAHPTVQLSFERVFYACGWTWGLIDHFKRGKRVLGSRVMISGEVQREDVGGWVDDKGHASKACLSLSRFHYSILANSTKRQFCAVSWHMRGSEDTQVRMATHSHPTLKRRRRQENGYQIGASLGHTVSSG